MPLLTGVHHVSVPASDPLAGSEWYVRVFEITTVLIEERGSEVVAVLLQHPGRGRAPRGLIWHSRQAELAREGAVDVVVLFGEPRYPSGRGTWPLLRPAISPLFEGTGRLLVEEIAERLNAVIEL